MLFRDYRLPMAIIHFGSLNRVGPDRGVVGGRGTTIGAVLIIVGGREDESGPDLTAFVTSRK